MAKFLAAMRETASLIRRQIRITADEATRSTIKAFKGQYWMGIDEPERVLWRAGDADAMKFWNTSSDKSIGGGSTIEVSRVATKIPTSVLGSTVVARMQEGEMDATVLQVEGVLDTKPPAGVVNSGFAAIVSEHFNPVQDLMHFDALEFVIKTDGRVYISNVKAESLVEDDLHQCFLTTKADKWSKVVVPFNKYTLTWRGLMEYEQQLFNPARVLSLGILAAERKDGPFSLQIESIHAINMQKRARERRYTGIPYAHEEQAHAPYQQEEATVVCRGSEEEAVAAKDYEKRAPRM